jgi:hypothetical protein
MIQLQDGDGEVCKCRKSMLEVNDEEDDFVYDIDVLFS